jgi:hypothetical protein
MPERYFSENTRIYTGECGSVWVKMLAKQMPEFTVLSYHPAERRIKAKKGRLESVGTQPAVNLTTDCGTFQMGATQYLRLANGTVASVADLKPGMALHSGVVNNVEGNITIQTIYRDIWLQELIDADMHGFPLNLQELPDRREPKVWLLKIEVAGPQPSFRVIVDCSSPDEPSATSGHNLLLWPDGTSFGAGVFAF